MREFRVLRKVFIVISIIVFIAFFIHGFYTDKKVKKKSLDEKYKGLITEIHFIEGMSNSPRFKINSQLVYFGIANIHIDFVVQIGDSIVKKKGQAEIEVYRRDTAGEWVKLVFE